MLNIGSIYTSGHLNVREKVKELARKAFLDQAMSQSQFLGSNHSDLPTMGIKRRKSVNPSSKKDFTTSTWWKSYFGNDDDDENQDDVRDPKSAIGKKFRNRFRVPFVIFEQLMTMTEELGFKRNPGDCFGRSSIPLELKVLSVLRILGRGTCFDGIEELAEGSRETFRAFFHDWIERFLEAHEEEWLRPPDTEEDIAAVLADYESIGLPGCLGSTDCVHVWWDRCPVDMTNICTGKEGFPTLSFQVTVARNRRILSVSNSFAGASNDKTIVKYEPYVNEIRKGVEGKYGDIKFNLFDSNGNLYEEQGAYLLCDNGFLRLDCLMAPYNTYISFAQMLYAEHLESARKDVECVFGILKIRWRCLKMPILFQKQITIERMFKVCCILHNMLLHHDSNDFTDDDSDEEDTIPPSFLRYARLLDRDQVGNKWNWNHHFGDDTIEDVMKFDIKRNKLANHFHFLYSSDEHRSLIRWR